MSELTQDQRTEIENLAALQFAASQIAIIVGVAKELVENSIEYQRGQLKKEAELRKTIFRLAEQGSTPAITQAMRLIESWKKKERNWTGSKSLDK